MTITIQKPVVRDIRHLDAERVELRLIEGSNFVDLVFANRTKMQDFLDNALEAISTFYEKSEKI